MNNKICIFILSAFLLSFSATVSAKKLNLEAPKKTYSLGGQITLSDSINGGEPYISASATWKPDSKNYWFVRGTARYNFDSDDEGFRYSWGVGYDDWHTGTWSFQLNNYEPIKPGEGLSIDTAIASIGYKFDSQFLKDRNLRSSLTLSQEIQGDPRLSALLQWSPKKNWFIRGILIAPLTGDDDVSYNYVFGYSDWRPGTFGFEYNNYESNPLGESNFSDGNFALTYKWKFK